MCQKFSEGSLYTTKFFTVVLISNEGSFCTFRQIIFPLSVWKGGYDILCFYMQREKYGILPSLKVKFKKICKTCAGRFQSFVKLLP